MSKSKTTKLSTKTTTDGINLAFLVCLGIRITDTFTLRGAGDLMYLVIRRNSICIEKRFEIVNGLLKPLITTNITTEQRNKWLSQLLGKHKLSQSEAARFLNISHATVSNFVRKKKTTK